MGVGMKMNLIACALACAISLAAAEIKIDWSKAKNGDQTIPGWVINKYGKTEGVGSAVLEKGSKEGTFAFSMKGGAHRTSFYQAKRLPVKIGDTVKFSFRMKGTGSIVIGFYCYDNISFVAKAKDNMKSLTATAGWQSVTQEIEIQQPYEANRSVKMICPQITINPNSNVVIEDLKIEHISK